MVWREEVPEPKRIRRKPLHLITICRREEPSTTLLWEPTNITLGLLRLLRPRQGREEASGESHVRDRETQASIGHPPTLDNGHNVHPAWVKELTVTWSCVSESSSSGPKLNSWQHVQQEHSWLDSSDDGFWWSLPREPSLSWSSWLDRVSELLADVSVSASFPIEPFPGWVSCQSCYSLWPYRWFFWMEIEKLATQCTEKKQGELHETEMKKSRPITNVTRFINVWVDPFRKETSGRIS